MRRHTGDGVSGAPTDRGQGTSGSTLITLEGGMASGRVTMDPFGVVVLEIAPPGR
jgi:hypothetical protein